MSDEVDVQCILPHPSLGADECQRIFELRLRELVRMFSYTIWKMTKPSLPGCRHNFKRSSRAW